MEKSSKYTLSLLQKWGVNDEIKDFILEQSPQDQYELCGWIDYQIQRGQQPQLSTIKTVYLGWDSPLFKAQQDEIELKIMEQISPPNVEEGAYTCQKCGSKKTVSVAKQLRSLDEPMTNFICCVICGNRWKE